MRVFTKHREQQSDPLGLLAAVERVEQAKAEVAGSEKRIAELDATLAPRARMAAEQQVRMTGDFDAAKRLRDELADAEVELSVRRAHLPGLHSQVGAATDDLRARQCRRVEIGQAVEIAAVDRHVSKLQATLIEILNAAAPYAWATHDLHGSPHNPLVREAQRLLRFLESDDRDGWLYMTGRAAAVLDAEPQADEILASDPTSQGRPASHTGLYA